MAGRALGRRMRHRRLRDRGRIRRRALAGGQFGRMQVTEFAILERGVPEAAGIVMQIAVHLVLRIKSILMPCILEGLSS